MKEKILAGELYWFTKRFGEFSKLVVNLKKNILCSDSITIANLKCKKNYYLIDDKNYIRLDLSIIMSCIGIAGIACVFLFL